MGWLRDLFGKKKEPEIEEVKCSFCGQKRDDLQRLEGGWICPSCARPLGGLAALTADLSVGEVKELLRAEAEAAGAVTLEPLTQEITPPETATCPSISIGARSYRGLNRPTAITSGSTMRSL